MEYNTKWFSQNPYQIHEEFGLLLEDLTSNSPNPSRFRPQTPWRAKAPADYLRRSMKFQSIQPNYEEHKIKGWWIKRISIFCNSSNASRSSSGKWNFRSARLFHSGRVQGCCAKCLQEWDSKFGFPRLASGVSENNQRVRSINIKRSCLLKCRT